MQFTGIIKQKLGRFHGQNSNAAILSRHKYSTTHGLLVLHQDIRQCLGFTGKDRFNKAIGLILNSTNANNVSMLHDYIIVMIITYYIFFMHQ